ncbi:hypothetical protein [Bacillus sp. JCM 19041]
MTEKEKQALFELTTDFEQKLGRSLEKVEIELLKSMITAAVSLTD